MNKTKKIMFHCFVVNKFEFGGGSYWDESVVIENMRYRVMVVL